MIWLRNKWKSVDGESVYVNVGIVGVKESTTDGNAHIREPKKVTLPNYNL